MLNIQNNQHEPREPEPLKVEVVYCLNAVQKMCDNTKEALKEVDNAKQQLVSDLQNGENIQNSFERALGRYTALGSLFLSISNNMSLALLGGRYNSFWCDDRRAPEWCFQGVVKYNRLLLKLPPLPIAPYRSSFKTSPSIRALRLPQLVTLLDRMPLLTVKTDDNLTLFLLHVIPQGYDARKTPDFDNYDVKGIIDTVLNGYGGDGPFCYTLVHRTVRAGLLASGTYALLCTDFDCFTSHLQIIEFLATEFPFSKYKEYEPDYARLRKKLSVPPTPYIPDVDEVGVGFHKKRNRTDLNSHT